MFVILDNLLNVRTCSNFADDVYLSGAEAIEGVLYMGGPINFKDNFHHRSETY